MSEATLPVPTYGITISLTVPWREITAGEPILVAYRAQLHTVTGEVVCAVGGRRVARIIIDGDGDTVVDVTPIAGEAWGHINAQLAVASLSL